MRQEVQNLKRNPISWHHVLLFSIQLTHQQPLECIAVFLHSNKGIEQWRCCSNTENESMTFELYCGHNSTTG